MKIKNEKCQAAGKKGALIAAPINKKLYEERVKQYLQNPKICKHCKKELPYIKRKGCFCNQSCSCSFNNHAKPKRIKKIYRCLDCNKIVSGRKRHCDECINAKLQKVANMTLRCIKKTSDLGNQWTNTVRCHGIKIFRSNKPHVNKCERCGFPHIEICHIKSICSHNMDTLVKYVNDISNLIGLCPNCHWELDTGHFNAADLKI